MADQISHQFRFTDPDTGAGREIATLTIVISNRQNVVQETVGPATPSVSLPSWLTQIQGSPDFLYQFDWDLDDSNFSYPPDYVILAISGTDVGGGAFNFTRVAAFASAGAPTIPDERRPYANVAEFDAYHGTTLSGDPLIGFSTRNKTLALVEASDHLDMERYKGRRRIHPSIPINQSTAFALRQWPRLFSEFSLGAFVLDDDDVPERILHATCEQAGFLLQAMARQEDPWGRMNLQQAGVMGVSQGRSSETWSAEHRPNDPICAKARALIQPFLATSVPIGFGD